MAQAPRNAAPKNTVVTEETANEFRRFRNDLNALMPIVKKLLPKHIAPESFEAIVISAIQSNPKLLECTPRSLLAACRELAELGLSLSRQRKEADILPRWNGTDKCLDAQLQIRYGGLMTLAKRSGEVKSISSTAVRHGDHFVFERGLNPKLEHRPILNNPGGVIAAYCVWTLQDGTKEFEVVEQEDIDRAKRASQSKNKDTGEPFGPWKDDYEEQVRKTAVRRASKYMPSSADDFQRAVQLDTLRDIGHEVKLENGEVIDVTEAPAGPVNRQEAAGKQLDRLEHKISAGTGIPTTNKPAPEPVQQARQTVSAPTQKLTATRHTIAVVPVPKTTDGDPDYDTWINQCLASIPAAATPEYLLQWRQAHAILMDGAEMFDQDILGPLLQRLGA